jgi:hypothetical protein
MAKWKNAEIADDIYIRAIRLINRQKAEIEELRNECLRTIGELITAKEELAQMLSALGTDNHKIPESPCENCNHKDERKDYPPCCVCGFRENFSEKG